MIVKKRMRESYRLRTVGERMSRGAPHEWVEGRYVVAVVFVVVVVAA